MKSLDTKLYRSRMPSSFFPTFSILRYFCCFTNLVVAMKNFLHSLVYSVEYHHENRVLFSRSRSCIQLYATMIISITMFFESLTPLQTISFPRPYNPHYFAAALFLPSSFESFPQGRFFYAILDLIFNYLYVYRYL